MIKSALDELTTTLKHPVSETMYAHRFFFIRKEHKHYLQTPTFREKVDKQNKAVMAGSEIMDQPHQRNQIFEEFTVGIDGMYWEI